MLAIALLEDHRLSADTTACVINNFLLTHASSIQFGRNLVEGRNPKVHWHRSTEHVNWWTKKRGQRHKNLEQVSIFYCTHWHYSSSVRIIPSRRHCWNCCFFLILLSWSHRQKRIRVKRFRRHAQKHFMNWNYVQQLGQVLTFSTLINFVLENRTRYAFSFSKNSFLSENSDRLLET